MTGPVEQQARKVTGRNIHPYFFYSRLGGFAQVVFFLEAIMSKFKKKFVFLIIAVITITALLLPAPKLESRVANLDATQPQSVQTVAGIFPGGYMPGGGAQPNSYTWAG